MAARTCRVCSPRVASHRHRHCRQVSGPIASASSAVCHGPSSTRTSTRLMPRCCAQATPATTTGPASTSLPSDGVSIRDDVLTGARAAQPRSTQYASYASNVVSSSSVSHFVAET